MTRAQLGTASGTNANHSRRAEVRAAREGRESWIRPYLRTRRAIAESQRLIDSSRRIIEACEELVAEHPLRACRQIEYVRGRLGRALARLERGTRSLNETNNRVMLSLEYAGDAPRLMMDAATRWGGAVTSLAALCERLDCDFVMLVNYVSHAGACLDIDELFKSGGPAPRLSTRRNFPATLFSERSRVFCIHVRRKRSSRLTVVEAPKRIFRGRAPPVFSTCSL
jgi:hypothetical protein